ncbi:MAG: hypothetical protein JWN61_2474, partial [Pseudonocardiales bacterium]|nr:hypothetical protein [Pseudonocardiales bacterium]
MTGGLDVTAGLDLTGGGARTMRSALADGAARLA